jgi:hypothetical protein
MDAKHKRKSAILTVRELAYDNLLIFCWRIYRTVKDFYRTVRKISHRAGTCPPWHVPGYEWSGETLYFLNFKLKSNIVKFKILQRMVRKFPGIQRNHQKSILFHETIPFILYSEMKTVPKYCAKNPSVSRGVKRCNAASVPNILGVDRIWRAIPRHRRIFGSTKLSTVYTFVTELPNCGNFTVLSYTCLALPTLSIQRYLWWLAKALGFIRGGVCL